MASLNAQMCQSALKTNPQPAMNMSHEIRTPLAGLLGMLHLLASEPGQDERPEYVRMALSSGQRLMNLLTDLLDFSVIWAGKAELRKQRFKPMDILNAVRETFVIECVSKNLYIDLDTWFGSEVCFCGDEARLRQILCNLVGNSIKFTAEGGIRITSWINSELDIPGKTRIYLSVRDSGIGIPDDMISEVFDRFTQVDNSYAKQNQGAGLGLAIVKHLTLLMDGTICVVSELGVGTCIYISVLVDNITEENFHLR